MTRDDVLKLIPEGDFYDCGDVEEPTETDPEDAVSGWVDFFAEPGDTLAEAIARVPMPVVVAVYQRKVVTPKIVKRAADEALDALCCAFDFRLRDSAPGGSPWSDAALTEARAALAGVARKLFAHGEVWDCREVGRVELNAEQVAALLGAE